MELFRYRLEVKMIVTHRYIHISRGVYPLDFQCKPEKRRCVSDVQAETENYFPSYRDTEEYN